MDTDPHIKTYSDIGEYAFGTKGRFTAALFLYLELYLVAIEFLILEGDNLEYLFPNVKLQIMGLDFGGKRGFVLLAALVILPTMWLKSLSHLAYISAGGVLASVIVVISVCWAGAVDGVGFHAEGSLYHLGGLPTAISLYAFCYCGHAVFPTISSKIAIYTTLINPLTKYALMTTPIADAIEDVLQINNNRIISLLIRTLMLISMVTVALIVPLFAHLMALTGSLLSSIVSMVLPCVCYLKISKSSWTRQPEFSIIMGIITFGVLVAVVGTYHSLRQIAEKL
ncbi:hypothetical protein ACLOJK_022397 [Asimina triloba]